jgi:hypothetical protein
MSISVLGTAESTQRDAAAGNFPQEIYDFSYWKWPKGGALNINPFPNIRNGSVFRGQFKRECGPELSLAGKYHDLKVRDPYPSGRE